MNPQRRRTQRKTASVSQRKSRSYPLTYSAGILLTFCFSFWRTSEASVMSTELRELANSHLLFWSSYDSALDAATNFFGPIDFFFRESAPDDHPFQPVQDAIEYLLRGGFQNVEEPTVLEPEAYPPVLEPDVIVNATEPEEEEFPAPEVAAEEAAEVLEGEEEIEAEPEEEEKLVFSLFQEGDGSETDPDGIPTRYLHMQHGDRQAATEALESTLAWRALHQVDTILKTPHPRFDICKDIFPHYFLGRDKDDHVVFLQRPALMDVELGNVNKVTAQDLLMHYVYVNEYLWQVLEGESPLGQMTSIIDLTGLHLGVLRKREYIDFLKLFVSTMDAHYPQRAHKTLILNAPRWFNTMYKLVSPMLRESTKSKIEIYSRSKRQDTAIERYLGDHAESLVPISFWSKKKQKELRGDNNNNNNSEEEDSDDGENSEDGEESSSSSKTRNSFEPDSEMERQLRDFVSTVPSYVSHLT